MLAFLLLFAQPVYTAEGVVNAASNHAGPVAPNTIVSIYGKDLASATRAVAPEDLRDGLLPTALGATGVRVLINNLPARMFFVSPRQLNVLIPAFLREGTAELRVTVQGRAGAGVRIPITAVSPALFQADAELAIASRPDGTLHTREDPARPGDIVILYANGLGDFEHDHVDGQLAERASRIKAWQTFRIELDGQSVEPSGIHYVGAAPGFVGVYQLNVRLPAGIGVFPEIRIGFEGSMSPPGIRLAAGPPPE